MIQTEALFKPEELEIKYEDTLIRHALDNEMRKKYETAFKRLILDCRYSIDTRIDYTTNDDLMQIIADIDKSVYTKAPRYDKTTGTVTYELQKSASFLGNKNMKSAADIAYSNVMNWYSTYDGRFKSDIKRYNTNKQDLIEGLNQLKYASWMITPTEIASYIQQILYSAEYISKYTRNGYRPQLSNEEVAQEYQENAIYIKSSIEGSGKSTLLNHLYYGARSIGVKAQRNAEYPKSLFPNVGQYSDNVLCIIQDASPSTIREVNVDVFKHVLRKEVAEYDVKNSRRRWTRCNAAIIAAGNCNAPIEGERSWRVFNTIPLNVRDLKSRNTDIANKAYDADISPLYKYVYDNCNTDRIQTIIRLLRDYDNYRIASLKSESVGIMTHMLRNLQDNDAQEVLRILSSLYGYLEAISTRCSIRNIIKYYKKEHGEIDSRAQDHLISMLSRTLQNMCSAQIIEKVGGKGIQDNQFNIQDILFADENDIDKIYSYDITDESIESCMNEWDAIIKYIDDNYNPTDDVLRTKELLQDWNNGIPNKATASEYSSESLRSQGYLFKESEFSKPSTQYDKSQFIIANRIRDDKLIDYNNGNISLDDLAKGDYLEYSNMVFESDDLSLNKQIELVESLLNNNEINKSIYWITYSGSKSLHIIVKTDCNNKEEYKNTYSHIQKLYFPNADIQCCNNSRLTPNWNIKRNRPNKNDNRNGIITTCMYYNPDAVAYKHIETHAEMNNIVITDKQYKTSADLSIEAISRRKYSPRRDDAIALLEGTITHGPDAIGAIKYIINTFPNGRTQLENWPNIRGVGNNMWSESEWKSMLDAAEL